MQDVALVEDQERVEDWPEVMEVGLAVRETVGAGMVGAFTVRVKEVVLVIPPPVPMT